MNTLSVFELHGRYTAHLKTICHEDQSKQILSETDTSLRWVQIELGNFKPKSSGRKTTRADKQAAKEALKQLSVKHLQQEGRQALERYFERNHVSRSSRNTYRARFEKLLSFADTQQRRRQRPKSQHILDGCCPPLDYHGSHSVKLPLTGRRGVYQYYRLDNAEMPDALREEVEEFQRFLEAPHYPGRIFAPVKTSTAQTYLKNVRLFLGYLHRFRNVSLEKLTLDHLVPYVAEEELATLSTIEQKKLWRKHQRQLETFIFEYFQFLVDQNSSFSPRTHIAKLTVLQRFCHFRYRDDVQREADYKQIPIFNTIEDLLHQKNRVNQEWRQKQTTVADQTLKMPQALPGKTVLTTVREKVLKPMREWCRHRWHTGGFRTGWAIASSTLNYLKLALVCDVPPRRQSEYRGIKLAMSCPIERPSDIPNGEYYWPLPAVEAREKDKFGQLCDNFIYKVFSHRGKLYPNGLWILEVRDYKTDRVYGTYRMPLPNRQFEDGSCFYDYLDQYVCGRWIPEGYSNPHRYDWWDPELMGKRGQWITKGIMEFNPETTFYEAQRSAQQVPWRWAWFLPQPRTGKQSNLSGFARSYSQASFQYLNVRINPHFYRNLWATWAFQVGLSEQELQSLAYAMGMSVVTMRNTYERCTPEEKARPIQEAIDRVLFQEMDGAEKDDKPDKARVERMKREMKRLSPEERQRLLDELMGNDQVS